MTQRTTYGSSLTYHQRFAIIFEGRTGSSYVVSNLNSHPDIICYPEILSGKTWQEQQTILTALIKGKSITAHHPQALRKHYFHRKKVRYAPVLISGFKTKLHQIDRLQAFYRLIHQHHFKLIYLKRKNVLKSVISEFNAERLKQKHGIYNAEHSNQVQGPIYIPPQVFLTRLNQRLMGEVAHETFYNACRIPKYTFYYEDLIESETHFFQQLLFDLGVKPMKLKGKFYKNTPDKLSEALINFNEIRQLFSGSCFDNLFEE